MRSMRSKRSLRANRETMEHSFWVEPFGESLTDENLTLKFDFDFQIV